ncbi:MAG TPA: hypothetical protein VKH44_04000, partial [Pirellulaceae bacterium]|nr:hypothetical protein [Pirellulaceae bacterium]
MNIEVNWRPHLAVSSLHAAELASRKQPIADSRLADALTQPALHLAGEIRAAGLPPVRFWRHLIPLAANLSDRRQLIETAVTKTIGRGVQFESIVSYLAASLVAVDRAVREALPDLNDELALRERPLREQWEARGAGMLHEIGRPTDEAL